MALVSRDGPHQNGINPPARRKRKGSLMLGNYVEKRSDNYDTHLKKIGVNFLGRKVLKRTTTYLEITADPPSEDQDEEDVIWHFVAHIRIPLKGTMYDRINMKHGVEFDYHLPESEKRGKGVGFLDFERNVLIIRMEYPDDVIENKLEFHEGGVNLTVSHRDGTTAWRYFDRI